MGTSSARDLSALAELLASSRFDRAECLARLRAVEAAPQGVYQAGLLDPVEAIGAARRAEGRDAASMRAVLSALAEEGDSRSQLMLALFGAPGRNSYFDTAVNGVPFPSGLVSEARWHELVVALETGDEDAAKLVLRHLSPHADVPRPAHPGNRAHLHHAWQLAKRHAKLEGAPIEKQIRWLLDGLTHRAYARRPFARGLALELGISVPEDDTNEYGVAAIVALVAQLPDGFPEWDELFELTMLELKGAHIGTTIGEALSTFRWDAIADERDGDTLTVRRSFRGYEVKWTTKLWRLGPGSGGIREDHKGRLSCKRLSRPLVPGAHWTRLLDADERARFFGIALKCDEVFALPELLEAGVELSMDEVPNWMKVPPLRAMAPHLGPERGAALVERLRGGLTSRGVLALLDHLTFTDAQLVGFAARGMTEVFEVLYARLSSSTREACLSAAQAAHREGTADVLRKGPPQPLAIPRIEVRLVAPKPVAPKKKTKRPAPIELPYEAQADPIAVALLRDRIHLATTEGDVAFERSGESWTRSPTEMRSQGLCRGDGFTLIQSFDTEAKRWSWRMWVDGQEPGPRSGPGASHPCWSEHAVWVAAGGKLVVVGTFQYGALAFPVSNEGEIGAPQPLAPDKVSGLSTDGLSVQVRRPATVELYERDGEGWRCTHTSTFSPASWAVFGDRFALANGLAQTKHGWGAVHVYRRTSEGWSLERELIAPKPKVEGFGTRIGLTRDALVVASSDKQGLRWLYPDLSSDEAHALPVAGKSRWALSPTLLVDAHRGKAKDAPLRLTLNPLG
jgi:hypothetical protein